MKIRYIFLIAFINFILQSTWLQIIRPFKIMPNTSLILVVVFCALFDKEGIIMAILCAVFQDLFFSQMLGVHLIIYLVIAGFIISIKEMLFNDNILTPLILIVSSTFLFHCVWLGIMFIFGAIINIEQIINVIFIEMTENAIIGIFVYEFLFGKTHGYGLR